MRDFLTNRVAKFDIIMYSIYTRIDSITNITVEHVYKHMDSILQLLSEIFLDSDFCHNYVHNPVTLNWLPYA